PARPAIAPRPVLPAPASANALALLRFPDRRTAWVVVAAATLAAPAGQLQDRLESLHPAVPMTRPPPPRSTLRPAPPLRVRVGPAGPRLAVACPHAAFDGLSLVALLASLTGGVDNPTPPAPRSATLPLRGPGPQGPGLEAAPGGGRPVPRAARAELAPGGGGPGRALPEVRGLVGRLVRPADRVAASL